MFHPLSFFSPFFQISIFFLSFLFSLFFSFTFLINFSLLFAMRSSSVVWLYSFSFFYSFCSLCCFTLFFSLLLKSYFCGVSAERAANRPDISQVTHGYPCRPSQVTHHKTSPLHEEQVPVCYQLPPELDASLAQWARIGIGENPRFEIWWCQLIVSYPNRTARWILFHFWSYKIFFWFFKKLDFLPFFKKNPYFT